MNGTEAYGQMRAKGRTLPIHAESGKSRSLIIVGNSNFVYDPIIAALLSEVRAKSAEVVESGTTFRIDLRRVPLPAGGTAALRDNYRAGLCPELLKCETSEIEQAVKGSRLKIRDGQQIRGRGSESSSSTTVRRRAPFPTRCEPHLGSRRRFCCVFSARQVAPSLHQPSGCQTSSGTAPFAS